MDIERLSRRHYKTSIVVAIVLSGLFVTFAALIGRGSLNLKGSLILEKPNDITAIALAEERVAKGVSITHVEFLRTETVPVTISAKPYYTYLVRSSDSVQYLERFGWDDEKKQWSLMTFEKLHEAPAETEPSTGPQTTEKRQ